MNNPHDGITAFLIEYCEDHHLRYLKKEGFIMLYFPGEYTVVYIPSSKSFFFSGMKIMEHPSLDKLKSFLDFIH